MTLAANLWDHAFALQAAKGTPAAAAQFRVYLTGGTLAPERETKTLEETTGSRIRSTAVTSLLQASGSPSFYARPKYIGALLYAALGAKAVAGAGDPYTHTITPATTIPWMTWWRKFAGAVERFTDVKVKSLTLQSQAGDALKVTAELLGCKVAGTATAQDAVAVEVADTFLHSDGAGKLMMEGSAVSAIESVTCKIDTGATVQRGDGLGPDTIAEGLLTITYETVQTIADFALWNRLHYGAAVPGANAAATAAVLELGAGALSFEWARRDNDGVAVVPARSLKLEAQRITVKGISGIEPNANGEPLKATVSYEVFEPAAGAAFTATLKNSQSAYTAV